MNDQNYKAWVQSLPTLTSAQLVDLSNRMKILSVATSRDFNGKGDFGVRVSEAICVVLRRYGTECVSPNTLRKSAAYSSAKDKFDDLLAFFEKITQQKIAQDAILRQAVELLYVDCMQWQGIAISSHTLLQQIHRLPSVLNRAFPGYAQSGLLHMIIKVPA